jgi:hypothetical protein
MTDLNHIVLVDECNHTIPYFVLGNNRIPRWEEMLKHLLDAQSYTAVEVFEYEAVAGSQLASASNTTAICCTIGQSILRI